MILSASTLRRLQPVQPFHEQTRHRGMTYGLSVAGYDVRAKIGGERQPGTMFVEDPDWGNGRLIRPGCSLLVSTVEQLFIPLDAVGIVFGKSTWMRQGMQLMATPLEPGWRGHPTFGLFNGGPYALVVYDGDPIAQIVFQQLDFPSEQGYTGKYANQGPEPTPAKFE